MDQSGMAAVGVAVARIGVGTTVSGMDMATSGEVGSPAKEESWFGVRNVVRMQKVKHG